MTIIISVFQLMDFLPHVFIGFTTVRFCRFNETVQDGDGTSTFVSITKESVVPSNCKWMH